MTRRLDVQVLVVGGGINGAGIARDLALRGVRCALVEKREFGSGTSWASSGMIHGGLRYLQKDPEVTLHSCVDSGAIQRIAPHLVFRIPFVMPVFPEDPIGPELIEIGLEMYDRYQPFKNGRQHTRLTRAQALELEPALSPRADCAFTLDEWGVDAARLCAANALDAAERGAVVLTHCEVVELLQEPGSGRVEGARVRDALTGEEMVIAAPLTLNATGPWAPELARMAGAHVELRPAKGIHLVFERRVSNLAVYARGVDGRDMFTFPHEQNSMAGTTDDDFYGDLDRIEVTEDEVAYVLQAMERSIPSIRRHRVIHTTQGARPTLHGFGQYESDLSRDYVVIDHGRKEGVAGLVTLAGGKLAAYRLMAEDASDHLCGLLGVSERCRTANTPLPGGEAELDVLDVARRFRTPVPAVVRLGFRHGTRTARVLGPHDPEPGAGDATPPRTVCACEPVLDAELAHVARHEGLRTLGDCALRVRLGVGACQGAACAGWAAGLLADTLGWSAEHTASEVAQFAADRWRSVAPVIGGTQLAGMEIHRSVFLAGRGFGLAPATRSLASLSADAEVAGAHAEVAGADAEVAGHPDPEPGALGRSEAEGARAAEAALGATRALLSRMRAPDDGRDPASSPAVDASHEGAVDGDAERESES